jgi:hypothetical protein
MACWSDWRSVKYNDILLCLEVGVALAVSTRKKQIFISYIYIYILVWNAIDCDTEKDSIVISIV